MTITRRNSECRMQNADGVCMSNSRPRRREWSRRVGSHTLSAFCILTSAFLFTGCATEAEKAPADELPAPVRVGAENVVSVTREGIVVGPAVSGEIRAERDATVRAEIGGSMTQVSVE